jgi:hypothetical protein
MSNEETIKENNSLKEYSYLVPSKNYTKRVQFVEGTKTGGKYKRTKRYKKRKYGGNPPSAENVYIPNVSNNILLANDNTKVPTLFLKSKQPIINLPEENIYLNIEKGEEAPLNAEVLATTGKSRNPITRAYHKIGKLIGTRPKTKTLSSLDFDLTKFNDTCLKDVPLTVEEINIFKSINNKNLIKSKLNLYCDIRNKLFKKDIHFDTKYPKIFEQILRLSLTSDDSKSIDTEIRGILFRNEIELEDYEDDIELPRTEYISKFETLLPRDELYEKQLNKTAGKRRIKNKKNKRTKRRYHKH